MISDNIVSETIQRQLHTIEKYTPNIKWFYFCVEIGDLNKKKTHFYVAKFMVPLGRLMCSDRFAYAVAIRTEMSVILIIHRRVVDQLLLTSHLDLNNDNYTGI